MALLAGERSQLLGVRNFGDPDMARRALETPVDRRLENRLICEEGDGLALDLLCQAFVSVAAEAFPVAGSFRLACRCRLGCSLRRRRHAW